MKKSLATFLFLAWFTLVEGSTIQVGADRVGEWLPLLQGKRVGVVVNQTSVLSQGKVHLVDTLTSLRLDVRCIFALEHGFRGDEDAGKTITHGIDPKSKLPIYSLYGKNRKPTAQQLDSIDVVVYDIQDVGVRFYTYISSLHYVMQACAEQNKQVLVFDRPNPNDYVDGPVLEDDCRSFVSMHPIPLVYGLTVGELAFFINGEGWLGSQADGRPLHCSLQVIPVLGWQRGQAYSLPIKPSPNLPNDLSIRLYPSLCFFEACPISVGRGTTFPFQVLGAPNSNLGSFTFTPTSLAGWETAPLFKDQICYGIDLREGDVAPRFSLYYVLHFYRLLAGKESFFTRARWFDLLAGTQTLRQQIEAGMSEEDIRAGWQEALQLYQSKRMRYLQY